MSDAGNDARKSEKEWRKADQSHEQLFWSNMSSIVKEDILVLKEKDKSYDSSWKKRGGIGAFMMLARKWDRIENVVSRKMIPEDQNIGSISYDIFEHIKQDPKPDGVLDDIRDLRRYLLLVEAEMVSRLGTKTCPISRDTSERTSEIIEDIAEARRPD